MQSTPSLVLLTALNSVFLYCHYAESIKLGNNNVEIVVPKPVILKGKDAFSLSCKPISNLAEITSYTIHHKGIDGNTTDCMWSYYHRNTTTLRKCSDERVKEKWMSTFPMGNAKLEIYIDKTNVSIKDSGNYSCEISAVSKDKTPVNNKCSRWESVEVKTNPKPAVSHEHLGEKNIAAIAVSICVVVIVVVVAAVVFYRKFNTGNAGYQDQSRGIFRCIPLPRSK